MATKNGNTAKLDENAISLDIRLNTQEVKQ